MILYYKKKGGEIVEKQTTIYLSEKDIKRLEKCKEIWESKSNSDIIKILIKEEYERIKRYQDEI